MCQTKERPKDLGLYPLAIDKIPSLMAITLSCSWIVENAKGVVVEFVLLVLQEVASPQSSNVCRDKFLFRKDKK